MGEITSEKDKLKALDDAYARIKKTHGAEVVPIFESGPIIRVPVESLVIGEIFGKGGVPVGKIIGLFGWESNGKTSIATYIAKEFQAQKKTMAMVDAEYTFDEDHAGDIGLNTKDRSLFSLWLPENGEQAFDIIEQLALSKAVDIIIVDSVSALVPKAEQDASFDEAQMGVHARLMSKAMRKLTGVMARTKTTVIFINQFRQKIGPMAGNTTSGGNALKFYASIRCEVSKEEELKRTNQLTGEEETYGIKIKIKNKKNKTSVPFKTGSMDLIFGKGFDIYGEYVDYGVKYKIITKSGSWYSYGEERLAQGRDNTVEVLKNNKALYESIKKKVQDILYNKTEELDPRTKAMVEAEEAKEKKEMFELGISKDVTPPEEGEEEVSGIQVVFEGTPEKPKRGRPSSK